MALPDDVVERIFSFLPPRHMSALSLISWRFRYSWKLCRNLSFDRSVAINLSKQQYINLVSDFLNMHQQTTVDKLCLYIDPVGETLRISDWIFTALQLGIKDLEIDFSSSPIKSFRIISLLFIAGNIKALNLLNCDLDMPIPSNHLQNLKDLKIQETKTSQMTIEAVFKNCLALSTLELIRCKSIFTLSVKAEDLKNFKSMVIRDCADTLRIQIASPTLCSLHYHGKYCDFKFHGNMPFLTDVILNIKPPRGFRIFPHRQDLAIALKNVTTLTVTSTFHQGLCPRFTGYQFREMEFYLMNLKEFQLVVMGESNLTPLDVVIFMGRCPRLERLFIDLKLNSFGNSMYWNYHGRDDLIQVSPLSNPIIQHVKIKGFTLNELPVTMARYFLKFGRLLQTLVIVKARNYISHEVLTPEHLRSEIQSGARIEIHEYMQDRSILIPKHSQHI